MSENTISLDFAGMKLIEAHFKIQLGITPSRGYVVMSGDQWSEPSGGIGTLNIADSNTSVSIQSLKIERVRKTEGLQGSSLLRVDVKDRRWKWGFRSFTGRYNVVIADNDADARFDPDTVKNYTPGSPPEYTLYTFEDIARDLLTAMGEYAPACPIASTGHIPLNKEWENANPAVALQEICEAINFGIGLRVSDNRAAVVKLGQGACPSAPDEAKINRGIGVSFHDKPDYVRITGNRIQDEITVCLEPVAIDIDGEIRKLADISYAPDPSDPDDGTGFGKSALLGKPFSNITGGAGYSAAEAQALAEKSVFKYFRIPNTGLYPDDESRANSEMTPVLKTLNSLDEQGWRKRPFVKAHYYQKAAAGGFENIASPEQPKTSLRIDHRRGLIVFGKRVGILLDPDVKLLNDTKLLSPANDVALTFAHELKGDDDFYQYIKTDLAFPPPLDNAAILTIKRGDLTLRLVEGEAVNEEALNAIADEIADIFLDMDASSTNTDLILAGAHEINLHGAIDSVEWDAKDTIVTHLRHGDFEPPPTPSSYEERTRLPRLLSYTEDNKRAHGRAKESNPQGSLRAGDVSADEPGGMEFQSLDVINAHHLGVIVVKDSRSEQEKEDTTYEDVSFGEIVAVDSETHRHEVDNVGPLIDMRYNDHLGDWLEGWVHGSFLDIETTEAEGQNSGDWQHLLDNSNARFTRIYYGEVPYPDPVAGDPSYNPSQSLDPRKPLGYVPGGVSETNRMRICGEMKSATDMPTIFGLNVIAPIQISPLCTPISTVVQFGALITNKQPTYCEIVRSAWDVNNGSTPSPYIGGLWGLAEFVRFKIFIDPDRTL